MTERVIPVRGRELAEQDIVGSDISTIPVRGRKHLLVGRQLAGFSTIPVRGLLHSTIVLKVHFELHCSLSPQGGKKLRIFFDAEFFFYKP